MGQRQKSHQSDKGRRPHDRVHPCSQQVQDHTRGEKKKKKDQEGEVVIEERMKWPQRDGV